ncbi:PREDICTED: uncharacterized protein LOC109239352 [Nicotiana attenuata]|uniref:uncharacterized protein LOC109239352 n=1 Tax=Nicotiana attenuata TaxID=49451 RepID=UPI0009054AFD|nr:PREDICTED: uncharacterized protein LOC109239352 [Nicotiana attenuata]
MEEETPSFGGKTMSDINGLTATTKSSPSQLFAWFFHHNCLLGFPANVPPATEPVTEVHAVAAIDAQASKDHVKLRSRESSGDFSSHTDNAGSNWRMPWTSEFDFNEEFSTEILFWVRFPKLPMNGWGIDSLSRIASAIETPIFADECTTKKTRVSFVIMLIEVNVTKPLPYEICVMDPKVKQQDQQKAPVEQQMSHSASASSRLAISQRQNSNSPVDVMPKEGHRGKQVESIHECNLTNFPMLSAIRVKNPFEVLPCGTGDLQQLPLDGGKVNKRYKKKELHNYIKNKNIKLAGLMETRVKVHNFKRVIKAIVPEWEGFINYQYAQNVEQRRSLWTDMHSLSANIITPWIICGEFNAVLYPQERVMGNPITYAETHFSNCIQALQVNGSIWKGDYYTWSNKQYGSHRINSRIDRVFGNFEWMMQWGHVQTKYDLPQMYDHSPMLLPISTITRPGKIPFRFLNVWADHDSFLQLVQEVWAQNVTNWRIKSIWLKLKALKPRLKALNNEDSELLLLRLTRLGWNFKIFKRRL